MINDLLAIGIGAAALFGVVSILYYYDEKKKNN